MTPRYRHRRADAPRCARDPWSPVPAVPRRLGLGGARRIASGVAIADQDDEIQSPEILQITLEHKAGFQSDAIC